MNEIESKFRVVQHYPWQVLAADAATECDEYDLTDTYFNGAALPLGTSIRIRTQSKGCFVVVLLTFKGPKVEGAEVKTRSEHEISIGDVEGMAHILNALGLKPELEVKKHRASYKVNDCKVEFDTVDKLGKFIEVEGPSAQSVAAAIDFLDMHELSLESKSYAEMIREL